MDEQKKFLETAETEYGWYYPMLKVMLLTGMRISEVGGLCWSDIDYDNDVIHIRRALFSQYEYGKKKLHFTTTKTINSVRDIPMMADCKKMLKFQKRIRNGRENSFANVKRESFNLKVGPEKNIYSISYCIEGE